jgi:25S rRNA (uracil2843-N3)-methyltransferase
VSLATQQRLLTAFGAANPPPSFFSEPGTGDTEAATEAEAAAGQGLPATVQAVKKSLYERDFAGAFATPQRRAAYVARWSAGRAVGYAALFAAVLHHVRSRGDEEEGDRHDQATGMGGDDEDGLAAPRRRGVVACCLGGGAGAELAGLAAAAWESSAAGGSEHVSIAARLVDAADWSAELSRLHGALAASEGSSVSLEFRQRDVLDLAPAELRSLLADAGLVTLMFTLNELFTVSVRRATALLLALRSAIKLGGLLLVVDSAGSYATVKLGGAEKKYPMQWLLDHTMLGNGGAEAKESAAAEWVKIRGEDSTWFRVPPQLKYPLDLENMRYQLHLYRRSG